MIEAGIQREADTIFYVTVNHSEIESMLSESLNTTNFDTTGNGRGLPRWAPIAHPVIESAVR